MDAPGRHENKVTDLLLGDVHRERSFGQLFESGDMSLPVELLSEFLLKILGRFGSGVAAGYEPERG